MTGLDFSRLLMPGASIFAVLGFGAFLAGVIAMSVTG